jgi:penicillin-binding protein 1C
LFEARFWRLAAIDPDRWLAALGTREGKAFAGIGVVALLLGVADYITMPPPLPSYRQVVADWHPSEAWLYDRHGRLLDSARVDFAARRLGWTPLAKVSRVTRETLVGAEDHRFYSHGGVDWLALAGATRDRVTGHHSRGASTLSMQVAGFLAPGIATPGARRLGARARLGQG